MYCLVSPHASPMLVGALRGRDLHGHGHHVWVWVKCLGDKKDRGGPSHAQRVWVGPLDIHGLGLELRHGHGYGAPGES